MGLRRQIRLIIKKVFRPKCPKCGKYMEYIGDVCVNDYGCIDCELIKIGLNKYLDTTDYKTETKIRRD